MRGECEDCGGIIRRRVVRAMVMGTSKSGGSLMFG